MAAEKTLAIVLRVVEFSETSLVVTLFTRDFGKLSGLAKGARRPKSPFEAALDLLSICRVLFLRKSADSLDLLTEAKLERRFRAAARDLSSLYCGYYVAELLDQMTDKHDPHPELFDAAQAALIALDDGKDGATQILGFELTALRLLGHLPSLDACVSCGRPRESEGRVSFGLVSGGVLCPNCRTGKRHVVSLSGPAWSTLATFAEAAVEDWQRLEIPADVRGEVRGIMNQYLAHLLGRRPKMHEHLGLLGR